MFVVYLRRELRRRLRQAVLISAGLALGVGLVITVTAASAGVRDAQGSVLHALYGVGTDMTVTQAAAAGSSQSARVQIRQQVRGSIGGSAGAGTRFSRDLLMASGSGLGTLSASSVAGIARLPGVSAAGGGLLLTDLSLSGTIPAPGSGRLKSSISTSSFSVLGADVNAPQVGPLSSGKLTSGRTFTSADASASVALADTNYAAQHKLRPGSTISIGSSQGGASRFTVIGLVQAPPRRAAPPCRAR